MDLWVKLDKFWKKEDFIGFQRLYLPFQKWGICLIRLHCATAMIFIIYIHLYKQMYTLHLSVVELKKDHFEIYFIKCLYFTIKIHWTVAYIFSIDIDTVSSQKLNFLLGFISITMSNHAWSPMCMLLGGLFIRAYLSGKYTDKLQDNKNSFIIFFFFL
jgi:hypothetical protein